MRGETPHFDFIAGEANRGLALLQGEFGVPIGNGLLTTDTMEQAEAAKERKGPKRATPAKTAVEEAQPRSRARK